MFDGQFGQYPIDANQVAAVLQKHLCAIDSKYMDESGRPDLASIVIVLRSGYEIIPREKDMKTVCDKLFGSVQS
jgi:hypothetical protein